MGSSVLRLSNYLKKRLILPERVVRSGDRRDEGEEHAEEEEDHRHGVEGAAEGVGTC